MARSIMIEGFMGRPRPAHAHHILQLLGVKRLPDEGMPERLIDGVRVYVAPRLRPGRRFHRVTAICDCGRHIPVGRLHQHICK